MTSTLIPSGEEKPIPTQAFETAGAALAQAGCIPSGPPVLQRHWGISTILSFPTNGGTVWFKQTPPIFSNEGEITSCLARIFPNNIPNILAWGKGWMLMEEFPACDRPVSEHPLATLARIQIASANHLAELIDANCSIRTPDMLYAKLVDFKHKFKILSGNQVDKLGHNLPAVADACNKIAELSIPTTIVHGDFYVHNVHWGPSGWIIYDWTDSFLGNPFIDRTDPFQNPEATEVFQQVWLEVLSPETLNQAMVLAPILSVAHNIVMHGEIMNCIIDPGVFRPALNKLLRRLSQLTSKYTSE